MTDQEKFEQWVRSRKTIMLPLTPDEDGEYYSTSTNSAYQAYLAAKQDSAAEIANLNEEIKELSDSIYEQGKAYAKVYMDKRQLQADNLKLRTLLDEAAFEMVSEGFSEWHKAVENLAETPSHSLQEHDDELIERCAKVCDLDAKQSKQIGEPFAAAVAEILAEEIRELKGKP